MRSLKSVTQLSSKTTILIRARCNVTLQSCAQSTFRSGEVPSLKQLKLLRNGNRIFTGVVCMTGLGGLGLNYFTEESINIELDSELTVWPEAVHNGIKQTFYYFTAGIGVSGISAYSLAHRRTLTRHPVVWSLMSVVATITTSILCQSMRYQQVGPNLKHFAWFSHTVAVGCSLAPLRDHVQNKFTKR